MNRETPRATCLLLERRIRALTRHLPLAIGGRETGVHQARVASRRLREALPVLGKDLDGTSKAAKAQRKVRKLTRALGAVRELDVTLTVIDELAAAATLPRPALEHVRSHVLDERRRRRETMLKRLGDVPVAKLQRRLTAVAEALQTATSQRWRGALGSRLNRRAKALRRAVAEAGQMYSAERLHQVRIAAKKLRYGLEIAAEAGLKAATALVRQVKKAQDALGRLHDLQVLEAHVAAVRAKPAGKASEDEGLAQIARALEDECRHLHSRYIALSPALAAAIDGTRRLVLAQLVRLPRAGRGLKMALTARPRRTSTAAASRPTGTQGRS